MRVLVPGGAGYIASHTCFSSSCATHGVPTQLPVVETERQNPIKSYGRSKLMGEMILRDACAAHGLAAVALRHFNAAGPDPDGDCGEEHDPETHFVPLVLQAAACLRSDIAIFGSDYDTEDGTCIRDYVHVTDLASAHVAALSASQPGKFAAYNLGTGTGSSITEVMTRAREMTGKRISVTTAARRLGDPPTLVTDAARARAELKWAPIHSEPDRIIQSAWLWMTAHRKSAISG